MSIQSSSVNARGTENVFRILGARSRRIVGIGIVVLSSALISIATWLLQNEYVQQRNTAQLEELARQVLHRTELAIDYAVISLGDVISPTGDLCHPQALRSLGEQVFFRGAVKEISVHDPGGKLLCSTQAAVEERTVDLWTEMAEFAALNPSITLQPIQPEAHGLFRVLWRVNGSYTVSATLNIDMLMFDIFPAALRDDAFADVVIGSEHVVARFGAVTNLSSSSPAMTFEVDAARYPIVARLGVGERAFAGWNAGSASTKLVLGAFLGAALGGLIARAAFRPVGPVEILRSAIQARELVPFYQPIFALPSQKIVGCEVLVRWIRTDGTIVVPDQFIPLAESSGLVALMTENIIEQALRQLRPLLRHTPDFKVAFNISPSHFTSRDFLDRLDRLVDQSGCTRQQVVLELTERTSFDDMSFAVTVAGTASDRGYCISLDDTGAGHNGLGHIQDLRPSVIKIDKKFVDVVSTDPTADAIIEVLVRLADRIGATLVAEGVEHEHQVTALSRFGVHQAQGYLVSKPLNYETFKTFLVNHGFRSLNESDGVSQPQR
ncbi:EAL domain-containing protein [Thalassospira xiamenensis]|uniref:Sensor c-di-GMP phosphodiesterase, contains CSS-motif sensor and EAL domain n=1 Tax=Thalassospira xiamenensis TaxID=220697 RepID=A0A285U2S3_9PROT|nr:EAL domain-containing protein [Thalassospira xiamenensis]SOC31030.1 sensor c-di-GMP phosphodiesterase, contains CSS-motif sensor and EAL domain [Thalassospira xiamenensis]